MRRVLLAAAAVVLLAGCASDGGAPADVTTSGGSTSSSASSPSAGSPSVDAPSSSSSPSATPGLLLPGMPPPVDPANIYAADGPGMLSPAVADDLYRVYVPNSGSDTVTVIDPVRFRVLRTFRVGRQPQHVVPSWDLRTLWVNNDRGDSLTPISPRTGQPGRAVRVLDPYNLYFTPDGKHAVVMASKLQRLDFRDPHTMALQHSVPVPCQGVNHADWTADGRFFLVSCEFSGQLLWVDTERERIVRVIDLPRGAQPQDVKISPDGTTFYVADMMSDGVWRFRCKRDVLRPEGLMRTGSGAHGLYVSRDARFLYVSNRGAGTISVIDFADGRIHATWRIPRGSPDMGNLSPDGTVLWLSGRYGGEVYAISTRTGKLLARIKVGSQPHGLTVWPQPGRYSLGHTGILR